MFLIDVDPVKEITRLFGGHSVDPETIWSPHPKQRLALESEADVLFFGGRAGGGKTDLLLGAPLFAAPETSAIIIRRHYTELITAQHRLKGIIESHGGHVTKLEAKYPSSRAWIQWGHMARTEDIMKRQGHGIEWWMFDEITNLQEYVFRIIQSWARAQSGRRSRIICTGNPPFLVETDGGRQGSWVIRYWAPWLQRGHPNPAEPGELRWFVSTTQPDGSWGDVEVDGPEPVKIDGQMLTPRSRTYIPSGAEDNPSLDASYQATLDSLPEPARSALRDGDFYAGMSIDDPFGLVPGAWLERSHDRWSKYGRGGEPPEGAAMSAIGVDVSRGGADATVVIRRYSTPHGDWVAKPVVLPGSMVRDGSAVAQVVLRYRTDDATVHVDAVGVGAAALDSIRLIIPREETRALNGGASSWRRPRSLAGASVHGFANCRADWFWGVREALDPEHGTGLMLPPDDAMDEELRTIRWMPRGRNLAMEPKEQLRKRLGRSPDRADALTYATVTIPRAIAI